MAESSTFGSDSTEKGKSMEEDSNIVTMLDVLKEEQDQEDNMKAVLGASDDKNCTYSKGYVKRQALYACATCIPVDESFKPGGICLACSYHCHEGHELVELYTKRNFRCDCGNSRFTDVNGASKKCNLEPCKDSTNELNKYNQNFQGLYCICSRPYPDPDDTVVDDMIQCIICEDWHHGRHLGTHVPAESDYGEMVCGGCMKKHPFLWSYKGLAVTKTEGDESKDVSVDVSTPGRGEPEQSSSTSGKQLEVEPSVDSGCFVKDQPPSLLENTAVFFAEGWRNHLCSCDSCKIRYEQQGLSFLQDEQDPVQVYEERGKASAREQGRDSQYEAGMRALSSLNRVQQVEAIEGYNNMKQHLMDYLQKFAESKKVVREEDIREFFSGMEARKKRRLNTVPPPFCHI